MLNLVIAILVVFAMAAAITFASTGHARPMRQWLWIALFEYLVCGVAQLIYTRLIINGGDSLFYARLGGELARMLDDSFAWTSRELLLMFFQQPSALDPLIIVPGTNTGSMIAVTTFLLFLFRGSDFAAHFFVTGMSLFGALAIYNAARDAVPEGASPRLFAATVLFPSVAFWTSALHKEAFAVAGIGALMAAWRHARRKRFRALLYAPIGITLILLFRPPALVPLLLGLVVFATWKRLQNVRGSDVVLVGPVYVFLAFGVVVLGMIAVSRISPELAIDRLDEALARRQQSWTLAQGGSSFALEGDVPQTFAGQLLRLPMALVNALFRPQFFDVRNVAMLISAVEMTLITYFVYRALRHHGLGGLFTRIQRSSFALMCAVITFVGCTMVGLVTFNFGSLVRYRAPFLPFYGALLVMVVPARAAAAVDRARLRPGVRGKRPSPKAAPAAARRSGVI